MIMILSKQVTNLLMLAAMLVLAATISSSADAYMIQLPKVSSLDKVSDLGSSVCSRRDWWQNVATLTSAGVIATTTCITASEPAWASGGATAGRYTTIPIAKRRYYGRVQEGVHEFLLMGSSVVNGALTDETVQHFFDPQGALIVAARRQDVNGQCTKKDGDCRGREIRDSRYNDMKASMYLLGNAFRTDQQKAPDRLPTVKAAKAFFTEVDALEKIVRGKKVKDSNEVNLAQQKYASALAVLDQYLDLVELPPTQGGYYDQEFDTLVGETARIT